MAARRDTTTGSDAAWGEAIAATEAILAGFHPDVAGVLRGGCDCAEGGCSCDAADGGVGWRGRHAAASAAEIAGPRGDVRRGAPMHRSATAARARASVGAALSGRGFTLGSHGIVESGAGPASGGFHEFPCVDDPCVRCAAPKSYKGDTCKIGSAEGEVTDVDSDWTNEGDSCTLGYTCTTYDKCACYSDTWAYSRAYAQTGLCNTTKGDALADGWYQAEGDECVVYYSCTKSSGGRLPGTDWPEVCDEDECEEDEEEEQEEECEACWDGDTDDGTLPLLPQGDWKPATTSDEGRVGPAGLGMLLGFDWSGIPFAAGCVTNNSGAPVLMVGCAEHAGQPDQTRQLGPGETSCGFPWADWDHVYVSQTARWWKIGSGECEIDANGVPKGCDCPVKKACTPCPGNARTPLPASP